MRTCTTYLRCISIGSCDARSTVQTGEGRGGVGGGGGGRPNRYGKLNPQPDGACKLVKLNFDRL